MLIFCHFLLFFDGCSLPSLLLYSSSVLVAVRRRFRPAPASYSSSVVPRCCCLPSFAVRRRYLVLVQLILAVLLFVLLRLWCLCDVRCDVRCDSAAVFVRSVHIIASFEEEGRGRLRK
jgi:hypothetical protein